MKVVDARTFFVSLVAVAATVSGRSATLTTSATITGSVVSCIDFQCGPPVDLNLSNPTSVSTTVGATATTTSPYSGTQDVTFTGSASSQYFGNSAILDARGDVSCNTFSCFGPPYMASYATSTATFDLSDEIGFYTGTGGGFYEITFSTNMNISLNAEASVTVQGTRYYTDFAVNQSGTYTTTPAPFVDGVPVDLELSARAMGSAVCCGYGDIDADRATIELSYYITVLDSNLQMIPSFEYADLTGIQYNFANLREGGELIPEPSTLALIFAAGIALFSRSVRRRALFH